MIKNYKLFTESKKEELNFDLLESMSIVYSALLKIVEVHGFPESCQGDKLVKAGK